jgi:dsRNA-specific ribonuclease
MAKKLVSNAILARLGSSYMHIKPNIGNKSADGGPITPSMYANTVEALIGALYLDRGLSFTSKQVLSWLKPFTDKADQTKTHRTLLKEYLEQHGLPKASYESKPYQKGDIKGMLAHCVVKTDTQTFNASAHDAGTSKKRAQESAAKKMLQLLKA